MEKICLAVFVLLAAYFIWMRFAKVEKDWSEGKRKSTSLLERLFGDGVTAVLRFGREHFRWKLSGGRLEQMKKVYVGKKETEIFYRHYGRLGCQIAGTLLIGLFLVSISGLFKAQGQLLDGYFLRREGVTGQEKTVALSAEAEGEKKQVSIAVPNIRYTQEELEERFAEAKGYIEQSYLGENSSAEEISDSLCLAASIPDSAIAVEWELGASGLIAEDGSISNENLEEETQTEITAVLSYGEETREVTLQLTILPWEKTEEESYWDKWQEALEQNQEESKSEEYLALPESVDGKTVTYTEEALSVQRILLAALFLLPCLIVLLQEDKLQKKIAQRQKEMKMDYPEFVERFVLLIGAGLTVRGAWERIASDYLERQQEEKLHYVYEEMLVSVREMDNGMSEARAYELFGKRTGLLQYMKFCTLIVQNLKKGSADLLNILQYEVTDAFRERKENAKALGEEAGTKLLMPMMMMLLVVFGLILYAAFQNM